MKKFIEKFGRKKPPDHSPELGGATAAQAENVQGYDIREKLTKIHKAAWTGDLAKVKQLAKKDPNSPDKEFRTPLHLACVAGHASVVQELLEWNAKTNVGDGHAKTPLMKAAECNREECVKLLLEHRAEVDAIDTEGNTALHVAVKYGFTNIVLAMIIAGANLNLKNKEGQAPLHLSVISGKREDISRLLLEHRAEPNTVDKVMRTPLHYACDVDSINQVKQLLEKGANTSMKDAKGWTADDCAVMKANHACSQLVYDHILQQRKYTQMSSSVPNTPRSGVGSLPPSSQTTPRTTTETSDFGMPAAPVADGSESGDETISKASASGADKHTDSWAEDTDVSSVIGGCHVNNSITYLSGSESGDETISKASASGADKHTDSWAEDTDVSSAIDDHKKKQSLVMQDSGKQTGQVKVSLTKNINLESDDERQSPTHGGGPTGESPVPRPGSDSIRTIQTRIPTPDSVRSSPGTPGLTPSPKPGSPGVRGGNQSKIPVRQQLSGASQTSIEDNWSDGEQVQRSTKVSFKEEKDIRNISMTDDDTDVEDDEEEEEADPPKKRKIDTEPAPAVASYTPSGMAAVTAPNKETAEKMIAEGQTEKAFLESIGMENDVDVDDVSDVSFDETDNDHMTSPRAGKEADEPTTPRKGILKVTDQGKPPSTQKQPSDDEESDWDSTKHSETESRHSDAVSTPRERVKAQPKVKVIHGDEDEEESDDEIDNEMESTLNPENSLKAETDSEAEEIIEEQNVAAAAQESSSTENISSQEKLANTGQLDALAIQELNETMSAQDKLANTGQLEAVAIQELNSSSDTSHHGSRSSSFAIDSSQRGSLHIIEEEMTEDDQKSGFQSETERSLMVIDVAADNVKKPFSPVQELSDEEVVDVKEVESLYDTEDETIDKVVAEVEEEERPGDYHGKRIEEIEQMIEEMLGENDEDSGDDDQDGGAGAKKEGSDKSSHKSSKSERSDKKSTELNLGVLDPTKAPKCLWDYEPSTTEEGDSDLSDSDTLDTESIHEELAPMPDRHRPPKGRSPKTVLSKGSRAGSAELNSDKEVAHVLAVESPSVDGSKLLAPGSEDNNRRSTDPVTQDTMEDQMSIRSGEETSQWDSTEEGYSPRTPRDEARIRGQDVSVSGAVEFEDEVEEIDDHIEEAVTAFTSPAKPLQKSPAPSYGTPEPKSDNSPPRSHTTPEPHTVSATSTSSVQRTVITAVVEEPPSPRQQEEVEEEGEGEEEEDGDSEWDSEASTNSAEDEAPPVYMPTEPQEIHQAAPQHKEVPWADGTPRAGDTPRGGETPRGQTTSTVSEEESASEWELERQKEKEKKRLADLEEEQKRQEEWEEEERRRQEQLAREVEEELRREEMQKGTSSESEDDVSDVEYDKIDDVNDDVQEHSHRSIETSQRSQESEVIEVMETSQRSQRSNFAEILSSFQKSEKPVRTDSPVARTDSQRSEGSQRSQLSAGVKVTSQKSDLSDHSQSQSSHQSPRTFELKKPPPKLVVSQFIPKSPRNPIKMGEIENESPVPAIDQIDAVRNVQVHSKPPQEEEVDHIAGEIYDVDGDKFDSDEDIGDIENEEVVEDEIEPVYDKKEEMFNAKLVEKQELFIAKEEMVTQSKDTRKDLSSAPPANVYDAISPSIEPPPPPLPLTSAPKVMSQQHRDVIGHVDETVDIESPRLPHRPGSPPFNLPDLAGNTGLYVSGLEVPFDDDGLSVTSTENGDISLRSENLPYGKDMLVNMNLNDANAVLKLQEHLREHRRQLEHEKGQKMLLENKQKLITKEKNDMQKRIDTLLRQKSLLEQSKLDLESKIRTLEYNMNEEEEKRRNAEHILDKEKEHHVKLEKQLAGEMEVRQQAELTMRNIKMDMRTAQNQMKELEEEKEELQRLLTNEKNARQLQEKLNEEQQKFQQHLHEESLKTSSQKDEDGDDAQRSLQLADDDIKHAQDQIEKFRNEALALRAELDRQRVRLTEENNMLSAENEKLQSKVEELRGEVKLNEEALTQYTVQQNLQFSNVKSESAMLGNTLEKERVTREKIQSELESVKSRLQATMSQFEKSQQARNELERRLHEDREEWARQLERKDQELLKHKETVETLLQKLNSTESKLNAVENELHISNTTLLERSNQNSQIQRDLQYYKTAQENYDANYRKEKEQNAKLLGKIESLQDRLTAAQHESLSLKQQLETAQAVATDRSGSELNDRLNNLMTTLKADHEKAKLTLEEKNLTLQDTISRLKEEVRNTENRRNNLEQDLRKLNQEYNEMVRKLSVAEATLEVALKAKDSLEFERGQMKMELEKIQQKYNSAQEKTIDSQKKIGELVEKLERTEQSRQLSHQQLADTSATMHAFNSTKSELEEQYQKLQVDNVRVEAELKHEKQKVEMLQRDLQDSQKVRSSLEALCSNLKSTNAHLEEKLGPEQLREVTQSGEAVSRNMLLKESEEAKELWEKEVVSRSKLGIRIAQLDRQKQEFATQLEEEKRKTRKALEQKRLAETKLEAEQDKSGQLQKEVANLKAYLKVAKKKLKDGDDGFDNNESRYNNLHSTFDKEREAMEEMLVSVKSQLEHMKLRLQDEIDEKAKVQEKNIHLESELKALKKLEKSVQKIDRSKKKLEQEFASYKSTVETDFTDKAGVEDAKKEVEARYRLELNRKLDEVNNYLEEQARTRQRLDQAREDQETKLRNEKSKLEEECTDLRIRYEQSQAQRETKDLEAKRYRDLYESEMQWRMRLSEQLYRSTDKAFGFKNNAERQRNRMYGSLSNLSLNGHTIDLSRLAEDPLSNKLKAELDRSIAKHLEAAPHDQIKPLVRTEDPILSSNFAKSNAEYMELLKRKYCV